MLGSLLSLQWAPFVYANTEDDVTGTTANTPLDSAGSYGSGLSATSSDVAFTASGAYTGSFTLNTSAISMGTLDDLSVMALTIAGTQSITLNGGSNTLAIVNGGAASDLLFVNSNAVLAHRRARSMWVSITARRAIRPGPKSTSPP